MKVFLLSPYFLIAALRKVQLQVILVEIRWKGAHRNTIYSIAAAKSKEKCQNQEKNIENLANIVPKIFVQSRPIYRFFCP